MHKHVQASVMQTCGDTTLRMNEMVTRSLSSTLVLMHEMRTVFCFSLQTWLYNYTICLI